MPDGLSRSRFNQRYTPHLQPNIRFTGGFMSGALLL